MRNLNGEYVPDKPHSQSIYHRHVTEARAQARNEGRFLLIAFDGDVGSGRVMDLWYDLGLVRPRREPKGFRGLWAFAFRRHRPGEYKEIGIFISADEFEAKVEEASRREEGWTIRGSTWDGGWLAQTLDEY